MPLPSNIPTGLVTGSFGYPAAGGGVTPDMGMILGTVTFTASTTSIAYPATATPVAMPTITANVVNGGLAPAGDPSNVNGVSLPATDSASTNPTGFTWTATFNLKRADTFAPITVAPVTFAVPTGTTVVLSLTAFVGATPSGAGPIGGTNLLPTNADAIVSNLIGNSSTTRNLLDGRYTSLTVHVLVLIGQSNMSGRGLITSTSLTDPSNPRIYQYGRKTPTLRIATEPLDMVDTPSGIGPGMQIARNMLPTLSPDDIIVLVPAALGGTQLSANTTTAWRWGGTAGNLSATAVTQTQAAIAAAQAQWPGAVVQVDGFFWVQGEQDAFVNVTKATYLADLTALIAGFRSTFGANIPFIMGQMLGAYMSTGTANQINWAHTVAAATIPGVRLALSASTSQNGDNTHYSAIGQRAQGAAMFAEFQKAQAGQAPSSLVTPPAGTVLISDSFNRANGNVGNADGGDQSGQAWTGEALSGGTLINATIISNALGRTATTGSWSYWTVDCGCPNYTITTAVGLRNSDRTSHTISSYFNSDNWVGVFINGTSGTYQISGRINGSSMTPVTSAVTQVDTDIIKSVVSNGVLTVYAGASGTTLVGSFTLPGPIATATRVGFGVHPTSNNTWDYITVTA